MTALAAAIDGSAIQYAALWALRTLPGFPPLIQTVHLLGIAAIMGSIVMISLRMLGVAFPRQPLDEITRRLRPWLGWALVSNLVSGSFFLLARPYRYFDNPVFLWKLSFLLPAIALSYALMHLNVGGDGFWDASPARQLGRRAAGLCCLALWLLTAMAGRWIAYAEYLYYPA